MTYYAVVDTNVVVSALLKEQSNPHKILDYIESGIIKPLYNEYILNEYYEVLTRNKFGFDEEIVLKNISLIKLSGIELERTKVDELFLDEDDIVFYEIVMTSRVKDNENAKLITGNIKHYPKKEFVVTPTEMIEIIERDLESEKKKDWIQSQFFISKY